MTEVYFGVERTESLIMPRATMATPAPENSTAAMLENILDRFARIETRLIEHERRAAATLHPLRPEPDPPDGPPLHAAAQCRQNTRLHTWSLSPYRDAEANSHSHCNFSAMNHYSGWYPPPQNSFQPHGQQHQPSCRDPPGYQAPSGLQPDDQPRERQIQSTGHQPRYTADQPLPPTFSPPDQTPISLFGQHHYTKPDPNDQPWNFHAGYRPGRLDYHPPLPQLAGPETFGQPRSFHAEYQHVQSDYHLQGQRSSQGYPTDEQPSFPGWPPPPLAISPPFSPDIDGEVDVLLDDEEESVEQVRLAEIPSLDVEEVVELQPSNEFNNKPLSKWIGKIHRSSILDDSVRVLYTKNGTIQSSAVGVTALASRSNNAGNVLNEGTQKQSAIGRQNMLSTEETCIVLKEDMDRSIEEVKKVLASFNAAREPSEDVVENCWVKREGAYTIFHVIAMTSLDTDARLNSPCINDTLCLGIHRRVDKHPILVLIYHDPRGPPLVIFDGQDEEQSSTIRRMFDPGGDISIKLMFASPFVVSWFPP